MARPRSFDPEIALHKIKLVFWEKGFYGSSTRDLADATGLGWQSLYICFGNKGQMYQKALFDYGRVELVGMINYMRSQAEWPEKTLPEERLYDYVISRTSDHGCFLCNAAIDRALEDAVVAKLVVETLGWLKDEFALLVPGREDRIMANYIALQVAKRGGVGDIALRMMVAPQN